MRYFGDLGSSWEVLGASWDALGASWEGPGGVLGASWESFWSSGRLWMRYFGDLGSSWEVLGASWVALGPSWEGPGVSWEGLGRLMGAFWRYLGGVLELSWSLESIFEAIC